MALRLSPECDGGIARDEVKVIATHDTCRVALEGQGWSVALFGVTRSARSRWGDIVVLASTVQVHDLYLEGPDRV